MRRFSSFPVLACLLALPVFPAAADDHAHGEDLFQTLCATCHGEDAKGLQGAGSDIRDAIFRQVRMATGGGYEDMPEIELTEDEMHAIVAYLNAL